MEWININEFDGMDSVLEVYIENPETKNTIYTKYDEDVVKIAMQIFNDFSYKKFISKPHVEDHIYNEKIPIVLDKKLQGMYSNKEVLDKILQYVIKKYMWNIIEFIIKCIIHKNYPLTYSINDIMPAHVGFFIYKRHVKWSKYYRVVFKLSKDKKSLTLKTVFVTPYLEYNENNLKKDPSVVDRFVESNGGYDGYIDSQNKIIWYK